MTGSLQTHDAPLDREQSRYAVLRAALDDGRVMVYRDIRRIGTLRFLDEFRRQTYSAASAGAARPAFTPTICTGPSAALARPSRRR